MYQPSCQSVLLYIMPDHFKRFQVTVPLFICLCQHNCNVVSNYYIQQNPMLLNHYPSSQRKSHIHYSLKKNPLIHLKCMYWTLTLPKNSVIHDIWHDSCQEEVSNLWSGTFVPLKQQYIVKPFKFYLKAPKQHWTDSQETWVLFMVVALCDFILFYFIV